MFAFIIITSLTFHEAAHAAAATACGDDLAKSQGRVTLNPLSHIDLFGTIILPILLFSLAGFGFGYAKPVPFRPENFRHPRRDTVLVAMAGPAANLAQAIVFFLAGVALTRVFGGAVHVPSLVLAFFWFAIMANCILFIFNLIPLPPLDGHYLLDLFLSERARGVVRSLGIFGILIAWWVSRPLFDLLLPPIQNFVLDAFSGA
jgi:Zn-dependent protease